MTRNALTIRTDDGDSLPPRLPMNRDSVTENRRRPQSVRLSNLRHPVFITLAVFKIHSQSSLSNHNERRLCARRTRAESVCVGTCDP